MEREQTTVRQLRLSGKIDTYIRKKAHELNISQNAFTMILLDLGMKLYESDVSINRLLKE